MWKGWGEWLTDLVMCTLVHITSALWTRDSIFKSMGAKQVSVSPLQLHTPFPTYSLLPQPLSQWPKGGD